MTVRRAMTPARKRRIWMREGSLCWHPNCRQPVPMTGPDVRYDHLGVLWITGDDSDEAIKPAHTSCDAPKTAADQGKVAKIKRLIRGNDPEARAARQAKKRPIPNRGFQKPKTKPKWASRPFPNRR